jgi:hypothetical protein
MAGSLKEWSTRDGGKASETKGNLQQRVCVYRKGVEGS